MCIGHKICMQIGQKLGLVVYELQEAEINEFIGPAYINNICCKS